MRLDAFLVEQEKVASRGRARRAITNGLVRVDGKIILKPSRQVGYENEIEVKEDIDVPAGYMKLKDIQDRTGMIHPGDVLLDLGSSAGGFLMFASGIAEHVKGIEYSEEFMAHLNSIARSHDNITVVQDDVFTMSLSSMSDKPVDVVCNDITVEPLDSIKVLARVLPLLKSGGRVLQVLKLPDRSVLNECTNRLKKLGLTIQHILEPEKREVYVIAVLNKKSEAKE
jgi:23S rRNA (cytidine1920-2'-O)/16S rRNA (cytidine1409-2'-O)-methyltransferase